jgi:AmmeMemoRadiSam system protein B
MYSGPAAAHGYRALASDGIPEVVVILGPSHHTLSRRAALSQMDLWRTPLGEIAVDRVFADALVAASDLVEYDEQPHLEEHSLEVQVPFLQYVYGKAAPPIVPICLRSQPSGRLEQLVADTHALGEAIAGVAGRRRVVVIASTDFSHHIPHEQAQQDDRLALNEIEAMDGAQLLHVVNSRNISMCGPVPVAVALAFSRAVGAKQVEVLAYYTSGDIIGDRRAVVGYASAVVRREEGVVA